MDYYYREFVFQTVAGLQASRAENRWTQWGQYMTELEAEGIGVERKC